MELSIEYRYEEQVARRKVKGGSGATGPTIEQGLEEPVVLRPKPREKAKGKGKATDGFEEVASGGLDLVTKFLDRHSTAKIVVAIDTHCLEENGYFIYKGKNPQTYVACQLLEVSRLNSWHSCYADASTGPQPVHSGRGLSIS